MSYLVLARKYRPQKFDDVVGQQHITEILKKAIKADRNAHAYLFCGPRGIGKTSCARILAKSLNCENAPTVTPCDKCPACLEISKGNSFDVLEIDGASNRGIDDIRSLRENVKFAPNYGKYKIYIIDEVHMLTTEAFNALLKTLEEPPPHVKFIFATTAPKKVPATIISRCQRFDFKMMQSKTIVDALEEISRKEGLTIGEDALFAIAKASGGSLRDALSILDQLSSISERDIAVSDVYSMLGLVERELLFEIADALSQKDCVLALNSLEKIIDKGKDIRQLVKDMIEHFRNLMIIKVGGKSLGRLVDSPIVIKEMFLTQSKNFTLKEILSTIDMFIEAQETARITESVRMPLEVAFAKLTYQGEGSQMASGLKKDGAGSEGYRFSPSNVLKNNKGQVDIVGSSSADLKKENDDNAKEDLSQLTELTDDEAGVVDEVDAKEDCAPDKGRLDVAGILRLWDSLTFAVSRQKMSAATYLQEGSPLLFSDEGLLTIGFSKEYLFHKESLETKENVSIVEEAFTNKLKTKVFVKYVISDDNVKSEKQEDSNVKSAIDVFGGKVMSRWHEG